MRLDQQRIGGALQHLPGIAPGLLPMNILFDDDNVGVGLHGVIIHQPATCDAPNNSRVRCSWVKRSADQTRMKERCTCSKSSICRLGNRATTYRIGEIPMLPCYPTSRIILKCRIAGCCSNHPTLNNLPPSIRPTQTGKTGGCIAPGLKDLHIKPG